MAAAEIFRLIFGFVAVLAMIGAAAYLARKAGLSTLATVGGKKRRLAITETLPLDARRRLAIIRCDEAEYLVILGGAGETVLASGLTCPVEAAGADIASPNPFAELGAIARKLRTPKADDDKEAAA